MNISIPAIQTPVSDPQFLPILNSRLQLVAQNIANVSTSAEIGVGQHGARPAAATTTLKVYIETDRNSVYYITQVGKSQRWQLAVAFMRGLGAGKPADLGTADAGFAFHSEDTHLFQQWTGSAWAPIASFPIVDTHGNRAGYDVTQYPDGTPYFESDTQLEYVLLAGNWVYRRGMQTGTAAAMVARAGSLGANDKGLQFRTTDYLHTHQWSGSAWAFDPEDDGSMYFRMGGQAPNVGLWHACDGSTVNWCDGTGAAHAVTLPNANAGDVWVVFGSAFSAAVQAEVHGTLSGSTDAAGVHTHNVTVSPNNTGAPNTGGTAAVQSGSGATVASATHTHPTPTETGSTDAQGSHQHTLTTVTTSAARPPRFVVPLYFRQ